MKVEFGNIQDLNEIKIISDQTFGFNYLSESDLLNYFHSDHSFFTVAHDSGLLVGFSLFIVGDFNCALKEIGTEYHMLLDTLKKYEIIQVRKTTAVHESFLKRGIGTSLIEFGITSKKADLYLSLVWKRTFHAPVIEIITKLGFKPFCEIGNYWSEDSIKKSYNCPECGKPPCTCAMLVIAKIGKDR